MYSILRCDGFVKKTAKGVNNNHQKKNIIHEDYKNCLKRCTENQAVPTTTTLSIQSRKHQVYTVKQTKKTLSPFNDKKFFLQNGKSFSFGHKDIQM